MGFIRNVLIGIAAYELVVYLTKQDEMGRTRFDEIKEKAPEWIDRGKELRSDIREGRTTDVINKIISSL